jgi:hypothetical protein
MTALIKLNVANDQEAFDDVVRHLAAMTTGRSGVLDFSGDFECRYRDDHGRRCAVGALIDDNVYTPKIEGRCAPNRFSEERWLAYADGFTVTGDVLWQLQQAHDDGFNWLDGRFVNWDELKRIAAENSLDTSVLEGFTTVEGDMIVVVPR